MSAAAILAELPKLRVLVAGDVCLDRWCRCDPSLAEPSRETGIPRTAVVSTEVTPGAAGTIANNLVALGAGKVAVLGVTGVRGHGDQIARSPPEAGTPTHPPLRSPASPTFTH